MEIPSKIGRYEIKSELGRGGMATVYRAYDPSFDREVAVKVLPREMLHDPQFRSRFERELKIVAGLEHPSIVPVYDVGEQDGQPYFVMRFMTGGSLSGQIEKGNFSLEDTARIVAKIAQGLAYAHKKGIIHRDLKPDNILFDHCGNHQQGQNDLILHRKTIVIVRSQGLQGSCDLKYRCRKMSEERNFQPGQSMLFGSTPARRRVYDLQSGYTRLSITDRAFSRPIFFS